MGNLLREPDDRVARFGKFRFLRDLGRIGSDSVAGSILNGEFHRSNAFGHFCHQIQRTVHSAADVHVLQTLLAAGKNPHAAGDAAQAPEILILQPGTVAPAEDFQGQQVIGPGLDELRDVEPGFQLAVLAVADLLPVDPNPYVGGRRTDAEHDLAALPRSRNGKSRPVIAHVIVFRGNDGRIILIVSPPGIADINVHRVAEAVEFPMARNGNRPPGGIIVFHGLKTFQAAVDGLVEMELPVAGKVERFLLGRREGRVHRKPVPLHDVGILPVFRLRGR